MYRVPLPNDHGETGILVIERRDYPLTTEKVELAHSKLKAGIFVWGEDKRRSQQMGWRQYTGRRRMVIDFGNGPHMFVDRRTLIALVRHFNSIWRSRDGNWPNERAP